MKRLAFPHHCLQHILAHLTPSTWRIEYEIYCYSTTALEKQIATKLDICLPSKRDIFTIYGNIFEANIHTTCCGLDGMAVNLGEDHPMQIADACGLSCRRCSFPAPERLFLGLDGWRCEIWLSRPIGVFISPER